MINVINNKWAALQKMRQERLDEPLFEKTSFISFTDINAYNSIIEKLKVILSAKKPKNIALCGSDYLVKRDLMKMCFNDIKNKKSLYFNKNSKFIVFNPNLSHKKEFLNNALFGYAYTPNTEGIFKIPRPKPGLVTYSNKGILYINDIKNLPVDIINKLIHTWHSKKSLLHIDCNLQYAPENFKKYINDGFPADFCFAFSTDDIKHLPKSLLDTCEVVYFKKESSNEIIDIFKNAALKADFDVHNDVYDVVSKKVGSCDKAIRVLQHGAINALIDRRNTILVRDIINFV